MSDTIKETHLSKLRNLLTPLNNSIHMMHYAIKEDKPLNNASTRLLVENEFIASKNNLDEIKVVLKSLEEENELLKQLPMFVLKICAKHNLAMPCTDQEVDWFEEGPSKELLLEMIPILEKCRKYLDKKYNV